MDGQLGDIIVNEAVILILLKILVEENLMSGRRAKGLT
jgi:hypothetical protein